MSERLGSLAGDIAVVTGGAGDIGMAIGGVLAARGATVVLADVDVERARAAADRLGSSGSDVHARMVDLSDAGDAEAMVDAVVTEFGSISTLVNAAAVTVRGRIDELPPDAWDRLVSVNLASVYWTCRAAIRHMVPDGRGVIVNIGSISALRGLPGESHLRCHEGWRSCPLESFRCGPCR